MICFRTLTDMFLARIVEFAHGLFSSNCSPLTVQQVMLLPSSINWETSVAVAAPSTPDWRHATAGRLRVRWDSVFFHCLGGGWEHDLANMKVAPPEWRNFVVLE